MDTDIIPLILKWSGISILIGSSFFIIGYIKSGEIVTAIFAAVFSLILLIGYPFFQQGYKGLVKKETIAMGSHLGSATGQPISGKKAQITGIIYLITGLIFTLFPLILVLSLLGFLK